VTVRACTVSFKDVRGIRHAADVEAESLYEAVVLGVRRLNQDSWIERIGPATVLDVEVRTPGTTHAISLQQVERWLAGATTNPSEASKKAKLKMLLVQAAHPPAAQR
jgi:hypothetical protein